MRTAPRLAGFAATCALLFAGAALAGGAIDPDGADPEPAAGHAEAGAMGGMGGAGEAKPVRGLAVADDGLRLVVADPELRRGAAERLRFRIVDGRGRTVRDFDVEHTKRMHLIVARRDLTGFQHLHPTQAPDGTWETDLRLDEAGTYRMFADFARDDENHTLASDLRVDGPVDLRALPAPAATAVSDGGYDVRLEHGDDVRAGREAELRFTITRDGRPVRVEPYLGAGGHLVALREGDLAFLHVHPTDEHETAFATTFPTVGRYRLFLQFRVDGEVQTVAFSQEVA